MKDTHKLEDPGESLPTHEERKAARKNVWKRPASKSKRDELRGYRVDDGT